MGILNEVIEKLLKNFLGLKENDWVQWVAEENDWQDNCDKFHKCYFIVKQMPKYPQHKNCRCRLEKCKKPIPNVTASAVCDIRKFTEYIFNSSYDDGKKELFEGWGYTIIDSNYLQKLYIEQALQKYCNGDYQYLGTNKYCAKISIIITLSNKNGVEQRINTIWGLGEKGKISLITPYSGHDY